MSNLTARLRDWWHRNFLSPTEISTSQPVDRRDEIDVMDAPVIVPEPKIIRTMPMRADVAAPEPGPPIVKAVRPKPQPKVASTSTMTKPSAKKPRRR